MSKPLNHLDAQGRARMVDVTEKPVTRRHAVARGRVNLQAATLRTISRGQVAKGEVLAVARVAGIQAAKETGRLIPLCHPLPITHAGVDFSFPPCPDPERGWIDIEAFATVPSRTGVEMEALTAVAVAALTLYDMCKEIDSTIRIEEIVLSEKQGGSSEGSNA